MSPIMKEVYAYMDEIDSKLQCGEFKHVVEIQHQDGTHLVYHNVIVKEKKFVEMNFLLVWTEHCGYHAFHIDDLERWHVLKQV